MKKKIRKQEIKEEKQEEENKEDENSFNENSSSQNYKSKTKINSVLLPKLNYQKLKPIDSNNSIHKMKPKLKKSHSTINSVSYIKLKTPKKL